MPEIITTAERLGIFGIELSSGLPCSDEEETLLLDIASSGKQKFLVHNYFPAPDTPFVLNVAERDELELQKSRLFAMQAIDLAQKFNSAFYSIHAGFAARLLPEHLGKPLEQAASIRVEDIQREDAYQIMVSNVRDLADYAKSRNITLLIENNVVSPLYLKKARSNPFLLCEPREICQFFSDIERDNVGLLLDVAHAKISANALDYPLEKFINDVSPVIRHFHLSDNNGVIDSNEPFREDSWFVPILKDFKNCEFIIEVYQMNSASMFDQLRILERAIL